MCGICGYISKRKIGDDALEAMNDTMYHRGPNDSGIYQVEVEDTYFGFAQKKIINYGFICIGAPTNVFRNQ